MGFFFCFDKPNLFKSQLSDVQLVSSLFSSKQVFLLQGLKSTSGNSKCYMVFVKTDLNHTTLDLRALPFSGSLSLCACPSSPLLLLLALHLLASPLLAPPLLSRLHQAAIIFHLPQQLSGFGCICPHFGTLCLILAAGWMSKTAWYAL